MADHFYFRDWIRRNHFLDIFALLGSIGSLGVAALRDACPVTHRS